MSRILDRVRRRGADRGVGMIVVMGTIFIITALMIVTTLIASRSLTSSRQHNNFEGSLAAAESAIDATLARTQHAYDTDGSDDYFTPAPSDSVCAQSSVVWTLGALPTADQERVWARDKLKTLAASGCLQHGPDGDFAMLKPIGRQTVYAMGWSPRFGANEAKVRLIKSEYLFTPYKPSNAILSQGSLELDSSTLVTTAPPSDPNLAAVHSNGSISTIGNPIVYGPVTSSDPSSASSSKFYNTQNQTAGGQVVQTASQSIPNVSAREVWGLKHAGSYPDGWYDLCADGTVRAPDGSAPCAGTQLGSSSWRGWTFDNGSSPPVWRIGKSAASGVYYINGADVNEANGIGNPSVNNMTIIAAASKTSCNKTGGSIVWDHVDIAAPEVPNLFMLADQDIQTSSNFYAGSDTNGTVVSGLFVAGDQIDLETSSNGAFGAVVAADQCNAPYSALDAPVTADVVKNPSIYYDPNAQAPFVDVVDTTLWLEYPSGNGN